MRFARSRVSAATQWLDHDFKSARQILKRIAGNGFTTLNNSCISAESRHLRMIGCESATIRPNDETYRLLREEALSDVMWESGKSDANLIQMRAIDSLAALADNVGVIQGILRWGLLVSPEVGALREGHPMSNDEIQPALEILEQRNNDAFPHAILAIGQSGRIEFQERIENILLKSNHSSKVAQACMLALENLPGDCLRILDRLIEQYHSGHYKFPVLRVLGSCDVPTNTYFRLLPGDGNLDDLDKRVVHFLASNEETRLDVDRYVRSLVSSGTSPLSDIVDLLDPDNDGDREILWHKSMESNTGIHVLGSKATAIERLGTIAPDAAFEIGIESLRIDRRDRDKIPQVLMRISAERAVTELCKSIQTSRDKSFCAAVARALRAHATAGQAHEFASTLLAADNWKSRRVGAFVAGFLELDTATDELHRVAYGDPVWDVCEEAQQAIRSRQREAEATRLGAFISRDTVADLWGTIDVIVELADPAILVLDNDPTGFLKAIRAHPFVVRKYAIAAVKKRRKQVDDEMTSLHGKWDDGP